MICDHFREVSDLYVLGSLEAPEAQEIRAHLEAGCQACEAELRSAVARTATLSKFTPQVEPPKRLRHRLEASLGQPTTVENARLRRRERLLVALAAAALIILGINLVMQIKKERNIRLQLALAGETNTQLKASENRLSQIVSMLETPSTKQVVFGEANTIVPQGSMLVNDRIGITMIVSNLPAAQTGSQYESWIVPKSGAPRPIEAFQVRADGRAITFIPAASGAVDAAAIAVSLEPLGSKPTTPTKVIFAAKL